MKNVGILYGGFSSEFEISKQSATTILENAPIGFNCFLVEVTEKGWFYVSDAVRAKVNLDDMCFSLNGKQSQIDICHIYIHGNPGENGKIQAFLDMKGIPYINSNALASELSFDKWFCNQFLKGLGFEVANNILLTENGKHNTKEITALLGLPLFVKPADSGSSFGISRVNKETDLQKAIDLAFKEGKTVIIESFLDGREFTCGIYEDKNGLHALPITEIISETDFFDYEAKYNGLSNEVTPAELDEKSTKNIQDISKKVYQIMQLSAIARIDFMLVNGTPKIIEVNTTPGFSKASIVPQMIAAKGLGISQFWTNIYNFELQK